MFIMLKNLPRLHLELVKELDIAVTSEGKMQYFIDKYKHISEDLLPEREEKQKREKIIRL